MLPNVILFDTPAVRENLLPLTFTRPVSEIRIGILTIREKWETLLKSPVSYFTEDYLSEKYPLTQDDENLWINGAVCPDASLANAVANLDLNQVLIDSAGQVIAERKQVGDESTPQEVTFEGEALVIENLWDIFQKNGQAIESDYDILTTGRTSAPMDTASNHIFGDQIFLEEGATVQGATLNTTKGPIYIGKNAEVMEGTVVRGPFALCEGGVLKMAAKIYGPTTIGPYSKVGGEVNNSVITGYSNKAHDGFLGNSVIGEWCNLGADTNNSNLKNNYAEVKLWHYGQQSFAGTGTQFCGLIMGDHSKCGINTMFNTGTVVGVSSNIFGGGFPRNFIPSFSWGGSAGFSTYRTSKAFEVVERVMTRRSKEFNETEKAILTEVFNRTEPFRKS